MAGWGVRPLNWEFSAGIQHEIMPRLSATFGYFRRIQGNFFVTDNEAYGPNDFTEYSATAPTNARLPQSGQVVTGFLDPVEVRAPQNVVKDASQFGKQKGHWDGFDMSVDARLKSSLYVQGGVGVGKGMSDFCEIVDDVPEMLQAVTPPAGIQALVRDTAFGIAGPPGAWTSKSNCHQETPWQAQYKTLASYTLPWYGVRCQRHMAEHSGSTTGRVRDLQRNRQRGDDLRANDADHPGATADQLRHRVECGPRGNVVGRPVEPDRPAVHEGAWSSEGSRRPQPGYL
jgi:hypothetical protein